MRERLHSLLMHGVGIAVLVFGLRCLNYTKADRLERHRAFAEQHRLPAPGASILYGSLIAVTFGAGLIGYAAVVAASRARRNALYCLPKEPSARASRAFTAQPTKSLRLASFKKILNS